MASACTSPPRPLLCTIFTVLLSSVAVAQQPAAAPAAGLCGSSLLAVGSYTDITYIDPPVSGEGVTLLNLTLCSTTQGNLSATLTQDRIIPVDITGENPSYCDQYDTDFIICSNDKGGTATATMLNIAPPVALGEPYDLGGSKPTHIAVLSNGIVATASYAGSSFLTFDPSLGAIDSIISTITVPEENATMAAGETARQGEPHPHQVLEVAPGEVLIPDLGSDAVYQYSVAQDGTLTWAGVTSLPAGSGPRHAAVGPNGKVYVVAEISLQMLELGTDCTEGAEGAARGVCSMKDIAATSGGSTFTSGAAIRVSGDQKFVYMSLRVEESTPDLGGIVGFALTASGSLGELAGVWSSGGQQPRDFHLVEVPGFKEVFVVANRKSNDVTVFDRDEVTGAVGAQLASATVQSPVSIIALEEVNAMGGAAIAPEVVGQEATAPVAAPTAAIAPAIAPATAPATAPASGVAGDDTGAAASANAGTSGDEGVLAATNSAPASAAKYTLVFVAFGVILLLVG